MAPKLRVLISTSSAYPPKHECKVNSPTPTPIKTPKFEGEISVWVKDFAGDSRGGDGDEYFSKRSGMTYGMVVRGRFLEDVDADEVIFGNVFEKPIRDHLPWGMSVATKFMYFIDPTLELDIYADRPWALSPSLASMNYISLSTSKPSSSAVISEDSLAFLESAYDGPQPPPSAEGLDEKAQVAARRRWLGNKEARKGVRLGSEVWVGMEFANGLLDFNTLSATLPQPFHLSIPLLKYWDGQPVTYVCQRRKDGDQHPVGSEEVYFSVAFVIDDEEAKKELENRGGAVHSLAAKNVEDGSPAASAGDGTSENDPQGESQAGGVNTDEVD